MLSTILKNKADVRAKVDKRPGATGAQRVRTAAYEDVEAALYKWLIDVSSRNIPISGPIIEQKAKDFVFILNRPDFKGKSARDFVTVDDHVATTGELADEDIVADLAKDLAGESNCEDPTSSDPSTYSEALHAPSVVHHHCAPTGGCGLSFFESLNNVEKCMLNNALKMKKQKKMGDYFSADMPAIHVFMK
ncbi:hypothetical protein HPB49_026018 [Dermacentor silvarum]|nr:hypothetical protein HPB49_026018 [Dermacentor silvarum]